MAKKVIKKVVKKSAPVVATPAKSKIISVGRPAPAKVVTVMGIRFEQGDQTKFGKCQYKNIRPGGAAYPVYNFIDVGAGNYILWQFQGEGQNAYLDYLSARDPGFTNQYNILDFDTPVNGPIGLPADDFDEDDDEYFD
jgi:hypothetical protein